MSGLNIEEAVKVAERFRSAGDPAGAEKIYRQILAEAPDHVAVLNGLGICLGDARRLRDAREIFERIVAINPALCEVWFNLSLTRERLNDFDRAVEACRKALELKSDSAQYWRRLGICLGKSGQIPQAIGAILKATQLDSDGPSGSASIKAIADFLNDHGKFEDASDVWRQFVEAAPDNAEARAQWATSLIALGDYARGWREYECRWECPSQGENHRLDPGRQWGIAPTGRPDVAGKTLLIYSEQGIGDMLQFVRYADVFARRGAKVIIQSSPLLKSLLRQSAGVSEAFAGEELLPNYDWHIPIMSLPAALQTTLQTIPATIPYLRADPARIQRWGEQIGAAVSPGTRLRVGIAWAGNPRNPNDARRSVPPELLKPLAAVEGVAFFSLQKSRPSSASDTIAPDFQLIDFTASLSDFADTAALASQLDLVLTVDTAIAHLAGGLGLQVWTMLPFVPDPRWGFRGGRTPWYPTMRLFRQPSPGDWAGVVTEVMIALQSAVPRGPA